MLKIRESYCYILRLDRYASLSTSPVLSSDGRLSWPFIFPLTHAVGMRPALILCITGIPDAHECSGPIPHPSPLGIPISFFLPWAKEFVCANLMIFQCTVTHRFGLSYGTINWLPFPFSYNLWFFHFLTVFQVMSHKTIRNCNMLASILVMSSHLGTRRPGVPG